ncbi:transcriptional regulator [Mesorhizobium sp. WSM4310]|uniref:ATP-binding protein n=1 Tax=Mesorhizobium sp. WSM4310 TaxID=2589883 RepID=UPI00115C6C8E|nr:ATP-binding protein [Mesorhizobium sp. WSM4310]TRC89521.1 transcriptional regulator [Mesorhizobium sp. WSM4310]
MTIHDAEQLVRRLVGYPRESEWLEFKVNEFQPDTVGKYVSALSNGAILADEDCGYLVFGVEDGTHNILGTTVKLAHEKVGNDTFLHWLNGRLFPRVMIDLKSVFIEGKRVEVLAVSHGYQQPVKFNGTAYIRIDTSLHPVGNDSERERALWQTTNRFSFEQAFVQSHVPVEQLMDRFHVPELLGGLGLTRQTVGGYVEYLIQEDLIRDNRQGGFDVTNLLAIAAAKNMRKIAGLERKGARVIAYRGKAKTEMLRELHGQKGYGVTFEALLDFVMGYLNPSEEMQHGKRVVVHSIPKVAVREIVANAIIHQDFTANGDGPVIEVFTDRLKVTNPGKPLVPLDRFINAPSTSRNSRFGHLMRRLGICEERGSGVDRALTAIERAILPPPLFQEEENSTVVTLYGPKTFADMTKEERVRACYQHACLCTEKNEHMSNASFRTRLGLSEKQYPQVSLVIADARDANLIRALDEDQAKRNARYVPYWF